MKMTEKYRAEVDKMLQALRLPMETMVGLIFVTRERAAELVRINACVVLTVTDREAAREAWLASPPDSDPHGWGPTDDRQIAVICVLC